MKAVVKRKKPLLSKRHMKERLDFALAHQYWTLDHWRRVIWSDETKINCLGSDGRKWTWKQTGEGLNERLVQGTVKFGGGSVMVWGCFMWEGVRYATRIEGRMDGELETSKTASGLTSWTLLKSSFSRIMIQNIPAKRQRNGLKIME